MFLVAHWYTRLAASRRISAMLRLCCAWFYVGVKTKGWVVDQHIMDEVCQHVFVGDTDLSVQNGEFVSDDLLFQWVTSICTSRCG